MAVGVFARAQSRVFVTYRAQIQLRDRIMGGTPKDPKIIEAWLRHKAGIDKQEEIRRAMIRTMQELGAEVDENSSYEEVQKASEALAVHRQTNGFKLNDKGLYIEGRTVKAAIKESTNILFAGDRWLKKQKKDSDDLYGGKGPRAVVAERVFVNPDQISLGVDGPTGIDLFIGHTQGPKGRQSNLTHYEYVDRPLITFDVMVAQDAVENDNWEALWVHAQENGLGALRSQGFGRFDVMAWDKIEAPKAKTNGRVKTPELVEAEA